MATVSVVVGVYNAEKYLRESVQSILQQTFTDFELIIVDDGSTDRSGELLHAFHDPRIHVIDLPENQGLANALNLAVEHSKGEFIARHDADDLSLPHRLAAQVEYFQCHPEVGILSGGAKLISKTSQEEMVLQFPGEHNRLLWLMPFLNPIIHPAVMMRREIFQKAGGYRNLPAAQDYDLWCRLWDQACFASMEEPVIQLRKHGKNISTAHKELQVEVSLEIRKNLVSQMLRKAVQLADVIALTNYLSNPSQVSTHDAIKGHQLIALLCKFFLRKHDLSPGDRRWICQDAQVKLDTFWWRRKRKNLRYARRLLEQYWIQMQCRKYREANEIK